MPLPTLLERALDRTRVSLEDPLVLVRLVAGLLLVFGTVVAIAFWLAAGDTRFLKLVAGLWGVYGVTVGVVNVLGPLVDGVGRALQGSGARSHPEPDAEDANAPPPVTRHPPEDA